MDSQDALLRRVCECPNDLEMRLVYADAVEEGGDPTFADYIRLSVQIDRTDSHLRRSELLVARRDSLDARPDLWRWDQILASRNVPRYREEIQRHSDPGLEPAALQAVTRLEDNIGTTIPDGCRTFLTGIADGSQLSGYRHSAWETVFGVEQILAGLADPLLLDNARAPCRLSWTEIMGIDDDDHPVKPPEGFVSDGMFHLGEDAASDGRPGTLQIAKAPYGEPVGVNSFETSSS